jgi:pantoate--beta-alanine ligase
MRVVTTAEELDDARGDGPVAVVMTMGALHAGHVALMRQARACVGERGTVVVTIFVNPLQFGANEDFAEYPRTEAADEQVCREADVDVLFRPTVATMYGGSSDQMRITVDPGARGDLLEGIGRPGHFRGVLTVVAAFLNLVRPDYALFGEKDYQQLVLIQAMVRDLHFPLEVVPVETVREDDGLALSSRNRYLTDDERSVAGTISRALQAAAQAAANGVAAAEAAGIGIIDEQSGMHLHYFQVCGLDLGAPPESGPARILTAVQVGTTRLLDNAPCWIGSQ